MYNQKTLRKTPEGRKQLMEMGASMKGFSRGQGHYSDIPFTERRFCSWDGEGGFKIEGPNCTRCDHPSCNLIRAYGGDNGRKSYYILFGNSDGDSIDSPSLATEELLEFIIEHADIDAIHFGFAFTYDVNMILKDVSPNHLRILKDKGSMVWRRWRIEFLPRKWFSITERYTGKTVRIWDTWTFFMTSAIRAWREYGVSVSQNVIAGKEARDRGNYLDLETIRVYWAEENDAYVELMVKLRESLHSAGLFISAWHGPGAIASYSLQKHHIADAMAKPDESIIEASQYAYGGGRFEMFKVGHANSKVFEYDINSAYPYAISLLPNLARGHWVHVISPQHVSRFGVYRISWAVNPFQDNNFYRPQPFMHRNKNAGISFPCTNETWVWSPELAGKLNFPGLTVHEGWEFLEDDPTDRPFQWLAENYHIRQLYKKAGNQAQYALKLQMNSMYGKMAQRVGWNEEKRTAPKWHQLEWAGWVVSYCRAMVFHASLFAGSDLVSFETDAVFSLRPLAHDLDIGDRLGQWEETIYDDFVYLQSGCRFGLKAGEWKAKYRGFDQGSISLADCLAALSCDPDDWYVHGSTSRFVGFGQALHTDFSTWREFQSNKLRTLHIGGEGKRQHSPKLCRQCREGIGGDRSMHECALVTPIGGQSFRHTLPWLDAELMPDQLAADESKWEQPTLLD